MSDLAVAESVGSSGSGVRLGGGLPGRLDTVLERLSPGLSRPSFGHWLFQLIGTRRSAFAELSADWLRMGTSLRALSEPADVRTITSMLRRNARATGGVRIIGCHDPVKRQLVLDVPVDAPVMNDEHKLETLLEEAVEDVRAALGVAAEAASHTTTPQTNEQLLSRFDEAGWPAQVVESGAIEVPLEVTGCYFAARLDQDGNAMRISVTVLDLEAATEEVGREAATLLLWSVASQMRMVSPTKTKSALTLDVVLSRALVSPAVLAHGCAALSAALQQLATETRLLVADGGLASAYLSGRESYRWCEESAAHVSALGLADDLKEQFDE